MRPPTLALPQSPLGLPYQALCASDGRGGREGRGEQLRFQGQKGTYREADLKVAAATFRQHSGRLSGGIPGACPKAWSSPCCATDRPHTSACSQG